MASGPKKKNCAELDRAERRARQINQLERADLLRATLSKQARAAGQVFVFFGPRSELMVDAERRKKVGAALRVSDKKLQPRAEEARASCENARTGLRATGRKPSRAD